MLGVAHAFSRPLGIAAGTSHDGYNLICGFPTLAYWGDAVIGETDLGKGLPIRPSAAGFSAVLDRYRERAGLPTTIEAMGLTWNDMEFALTKAPRSTRYCRASQALRTERISSLRSPRLERPVLTPPLKSSSPGSGGTDSVQGGFGQPRGDRLLLEYHNDGPAGSVDLPGDPLTVSEHGQKLQPVASVAGEVCGAGRGVQLLPPAA